MHVTKRENNGNQDVDVLHDLKQKVGSETNYPTRTGFKIRIQKVL